MRYLRATCKSEMSPCMVAPFSPRTTTQESAASAVEESRQRTQISFMKGSVAARPRVSLARCQGSTHCGKQRFRRERLLHERLAGQLAGRRRHLAIGGKEHHPRTQPERAHRGEELAAVHVRHAQIE